MAARVTVVGAGVIGLSCAVRLAEAGYAVDVLARDLPEESTSAVAGGLWLPFLAEPAKDVARWARATFIAFSELAARSSMSAPTGVRLRTGHLLHAQASPQPSWAGAMRDLVTLAAESNPAPGYAHGWTATVPLVDMGLYLPWLRRRLDAAGGTLTRLPLAALPPRGLVVNCTGLSARALVPDPAVRPVRGQVALLRDPGIADWWVADEPPVGEGADDGVPPGHGPDYVLPHGRVVVVGGTAQDGEWSTTPDALTGELIVERARTLVPALRRAEVLGHRVGLRPVRDVVRLEVERRASEEDPTHAVVHCYGHGGSGVTLSWGCAADVLVAVDSLTQTLV